MLRFVKDNQLYIKYFLEDTETSYLIYVPFPKPDIQHNHLAGTIHYSKGFSTLRYTSTIEIALISAIYGERFDELSALIYKAIDGHNVFSKIPAEELID